MKRIFLLGIILTLCAVSLRASNTYTVNDTPILTSLNYMKSYDFKDARIVINQYLTAHPSDSVARAILYNIPKLEAKWREYHNILVKNSQLPKSYQKTANKMYDFAQKLYDFGKFNDCIAVLSKIRRNFPEFKTQPLLIRMAYAYFNLGKMNESKKFIKKYISLRGNEDETSLLLLAKIYIKNKDFTSAKVNLLKLLSSKKYGNKAAEYLKKISLN